MSKVLNMNYPAPAGGGVTRIIDLGGARNA